MGLPIVHELSPPPDVMSTLRQVAHLPGAILFDSARRGNRLGRYSFLTADPVHFEQRERVTYGDDPFATARGMSCDWQAESSPGLPPFQGGFAGLLSYELGEAWEHLPRAAVDEFRIPAMAMGLYDWVIAWDHSDRRCWIIAQGLPETDPAARSLRARERIAFVRGLLEVDPVDEAMAEQGEPRSPAPDCAVPVSDILRSSFGREDYLTAVRRVVDYIHAGDIFQANLSQRLLFEQPAAALSLYQRLRERNAAPFGGYFSCDDWTVLSASPERFLRLSDSTVETRPIKGTRKRVPAPEADLFIRDELRESAKDRAENVMIVDLLRNDLSRVCEPGSVSVPELCKVETYETVQHLVSEVRGQLREGLSFWDLVAAAFPGGSITGAPKIRAMEIIAELEPTVRGAYCGSLFYSSCSGHADSSILIRTLTCRGGWVQCPAGGGIVTDSDPQNEYEETLHKAEGMLRVCRS